MNLDASEEMRRELEPELLFAIVKDRYGHLLDRDQLEEVRKSILAQAQLVEPLRSVRLSNGVEPFFVFDPNPRQ